MKDYYIAYIEELEKYMEDLITRNEELESKLNLCIQNEREFYNLSMEALKYKKFKKLAYEFKKEQRENNLLMKNKNLKCENPFCTANLVSLIEIQKEHDKLLIENIKLRRENFMLKNN